MKGWGRGLLVFSTVIFLSCEGCNESGKGEGSGGTNNNGGVDEGCICGRVFGGSNDDSASSIQKTEDRGYIVSGYTSSYGAGKRDFFVIKLDSNLTRTWEKTFGGEEQDECSTVQVCSDKGYLLAGSTNSFGAGGKDFWTIKLDEQGNKIWDKTFGGEGNDVALSAQQTEDEGYVVAGYTDSFGAGNNDFWIVKTDKQGNKIWDKTFGGIDYDQSFSIQETKDGGYITAGYSFSYGAGWSDVWVIKLDKDGNKIWDKTYGDKGDEWAYSIKETYDDGYIIAGWTDSSGAGRNDIWVIKIDKDGKKIWDKTFGGALDDWGYSIELTKDQGYIIAGRTSSYGAGENDLWVLKLDKDGNKIWDKTFGGRNNDRAFSVKESYDGGYIIVGETSSCGAGGIDAFLIKLDALGNCASAEAK